MFIKPAERLNTVQEYYFSRKLKEIDQLNKNGADIINLGIGSPDQAPSQETINALCSESNKEKNHGYQSYSGLPALRKAFASWYKKYYDVDLNFENEILPLIGSKEGIMHISMSYLNPGDEVLVPDPGYPTYASASKLAGAVIKYYDLLEENNYYPDFNVLNKQDLSKVKIMWVNYPHMPSGTNGNKGLFKKLIDFGIEKNILICHDNPYSFILNNSPISILSVPGAKNVAIELNSLSKSHNMAGWRIGMVAGKSEFINNILTFKSNMDSGMFLPLQMAAIEALKNDSGWFDQLNNVYNKRKVIAEKIFNNLHCSFEQSQVGLFIWARIASSENSAEGYSDIILQKARVFVTPGSIFGSNGNNYLRLSLCATETKLIEALDRINNMKILNK